MATVPVPVQTQTVSPIATYFIGGASDKNRFWGITPETNLIRWQLIFPYLKAIKNTPLGTLERNVHERQAYFGYDEMNELSRAIKELHKVAPTVKIRLVGHSLGAWQAARLTEKLTTEGITVSLLITLDTVGAFYFMRIEPQWSFPRPIAKRWINVVAGHTAKYTRDDFVADMGIRWLPSQDSGLKAKPDFDYNTPDSHANIWEMMVFPGAAGKSAWDFLRAAE